MCVCVCFIFALPQSVLVRIHLPILPGAAMWGFADDEMPLLVHDDEDGPAAALGVVAPYWNALRPIISRHVTVDFAIHLVRHA